MTPRRLPDALRECADGLREDPGLGKSLLRAAHVHLMLGDTVSARRYYAKASGAGATKEGEVGLRNCLTVELEYSRMNAEHGSCRRAAASVVTSTSAQAQLKQLLAAIEASVARAPHNVPLKAKWAEVLSTAGRAEEARAQCDKGLLAAAEYTGPDQREVGLQQSSLWLSTLGRVLYDQAMLKEVGRIAHPSGSTLIPPDPRSSLGILAHPSASTLIPRICMEQELPHTPCLKGYVPPTLPPLPFFLKKTPYPKCPGASSTTHAVASLERSLYYPPLSSSPQAAEKLAEALQRPGAPQTTKPLLRLAQSLQV